MFELENQNPNKVFFQPMATFLEFYLNLNPKEFRRIRVKAVVTTATFGFQQQREEATTRSNSKVKEPTNMLVLCARKRLPGRSEVF